MAPNRAIWNLSIYLYTRRQQWHIYNAHAQTIPGNVKRGQPRKPCEAVSYRRKGRNFFIFPCPCCTAAADLVTLWMSDSNSSALRCGLIWSTHWLSEFEIFLSTSWKCQWDFPTKTVKMYYWPRPIAWCTNYCGGRSRSRTTRCIYGSSTAQDTLVYCISRFIHTPKIQMQEYILY